MARLTSMKPDPGLKGFDEATCFLASRMEDIQG